MELTDKIFNDIIDMVEGYKTQTILKEFVNKSKEIEHIPINVAKGKIVAAAYIIAQVKDIQKKYKATLDI